MIDLRLAEDYMTWHEGQVVTGDIDPMYPVLHELANGWGLDAEQRAWLVVCHVVFYHPGSTIAAFQSRPSLTEIRKKGMEPWMTLPCGTERRGHRDKRQLVAHVTGLSNAMPHGIWEWVEQASYRQEQWYTRYERWTLLNDALTKIPGNGRWAAYKTAEMFQKVCDYKLIEAADAGHKHSSGPRKGLALLEPDCPTDNSPESLAILDKLTWRWAANLGERDIAQVETSLCDFHSAYHGRYYIGHDIDSMLEAWQDPRVVDSIPQEAWNARQDCFEVNLLGEMMGWTGVRKELKTLYRDKREIVNLP